MANHSGPESCVVRREAGSEALTGEADRPAIEPQNQEIGMLTALTVTESNMVRDDKRKTWSDPARSKTLSMLGSDLHGSWEVSTVPDGGLFGRDGKRRRWDSKAYAVTNGCKLMQGCDQTHLKLKGRQPKPIDAYARAVHRVGDCFEWRIDSLTEPRLTDCFTELVASHFWGTVKLDRYGLKQIDIVAHDTVAAVPPRRFARTEPHFDWRHYIRLIQPKNLS